MAVSNAEFAAMEADAHNYVFTMSRVQDINTLVKIKESLGAAIKKGVTLEQWKKFDVVSSLNLSDGYKKLVFRNATGGALMAGRWQEIKNNADVQPYLMYDSIQDNRVRPEHAALDGTIAPVDDPIWGSIYPPNGHNCRCNVIQIDKQERDELIKTGEGKPMPEKSKGKQRNKLRQKVDKGWNFRTGDNMRAISSQTHLKQALTIKQASDKDLVAAWNAHAQSTEFWRDIKRFVNYNAIIGHDVYARGISERVVGALHADTIKFLKKSKQNPLLVLQDGGVKDLARQFKEWGGHPTDIARADISNFLESQVLSQKAQAAKVFHKKIKKRVLFYPNKDRGFFILSRDGKLSWRAKVYKE